MEMDHRVKLVQTVCETKTASFELRDGEFKLSMTMGPRETKRGSSGPDSAEKQKQYAEDDVDGCITVLAAQADEESINGPERG